MLQHHWSLHCLAMSSTLWVVVRHGSTYDHQTPVLNMLMWMPMAAQESSFEKSQSMLRAVKKVRHMLISVRFSPYFGSRKWPFMVLQWLALQRRCQLQGHQDDTKATFKETSFVKYSVLYPILIGWMLSRLIRYTYCFKIWKIPSCFVMLQQGTYGYGRSSCETGSWVKCSVV